MKLTDTIGNERYTYYFYDGNIEMHYWATNIGEANWAGDADDIYVRFYLSKGYKARNSDDDWVRVGTEQIKKGNLDVGAIKHEWHTLSLTQYINNGYIQADHVYNIVVCVDREHDTDNGDGEVPEMHKSNNCTSEAVFFVKESSIPAAERNALVALYDSTNGAGWTNSTRWKTNSDPCTWYGVGCESGHVTSLVLESNQLCGAIPAVIGNLTNLTKLRLTSNQLSGTIPVAIGNLTSLLELALYGNQLSGIIPAEIGNLTNLGALLLSNNQLSGTLPAEIGDLTSLFYLYLNNNQLSGTIPAEMGNLTKLALLNLSYNQLSCPIPIELGNLTNTTINLYPLTCSASNVTITVDPNPNILNAPWTLTGPNAFSHTFNGDTVNGNLQPGTYTLTWGNVAGWEKPSSTTQTLAGGESITFTGNYKLTPVIPNPPTNVTGGSNITIDGSNFGATQGGGYVDFNGIHGTIVSWSNTRIVVTVPNGATSGCMTVVSNYGTSGCMNYTVGCNNQPIQVNSNYYNTLLEAYNNVTNANAILLQTGTLSENVTLDRNITTTLKGGYNCSYESQSSNTTINGSLTIKNGSVTVDGLIIK